MESKTVFKKSVNQQFRKDIMRIRDVLVYAPTTREFFKISKKGAINAAKTQKIEYYITDGIYKLKRNVIVII